MTEVTGTAVAAPPKPGALAVMDFGADADNLGFENQNRDDVAVPFYRILQSLSATVVEGRDGHKPGLIINSVTLDLSEAINFVPGTTTHLFVEWQPRAKGGGFVGTHDVESEMVKAAKATQEFGEYTTPDGNELIETFYVHGVAVDPKTGIETPATIAFASTGIKGYRNWMTQARTQLYAKATGEKAVMPLMSHLYKLTTNKQTKGQNTFFNFAVGWANGDAKSSLLLPDHPLFQAAVGVNRAINTGKMKVDHAQAGGADRAGGGGGGKGAAGKAGVPDEEIPF